MTSQDDLPPPDDLFGDGDFRWRVSEGGYHWEELAYVPFGPANQPEQKGLLLTDRVPIGQAFKSRVYLPAKVYPLSKKGDLFRVFAELSSDDRESILSFANEFGLLGISVQAIFPPVDVSEVLTSVFVESKTGRKRSAAKELRGPKRRPVGTGEVFEDWQREIQAMKRAVRLHKLLATNNDGELKKLFVRPNDRWVYEERGDSGKWKDIRVYWTALESRDWPLPKDDERPAAHLCLQRWVNGNLSKHTAPQLLWDMKSEKHVFRFMPKNLLGALWLQFGRLVSGAVTFRPCKGCGKILTISADSAEGRIDRQFCDDVCRQRDHRRKVREANALAEQGKSPREIAKHFDTSIETIKRWLKKGG
jgi:hypothetical protein